MRREGGKNTPLYFFKGTSKPLPQRNPDFFCKCDNCDTFFVFCQEQINTMCDIMGKDQMDIFELRYKYHYLDSDSSMDQSDTTSEYYDQTYEEYDDDWQSGSSLNMSQSSYYPDHNSTSYSDWYY